VAVLTGPYSGRLLLVVAMFCPTPAAAQQLAGELLDVRHGLSNNEVEDIYQDRAGYLWVATWEGLNRFDGRSFERYDTTHGLPPRVLNAISEDPSGTLWVGTNGSGLARFIDGPTPRFELTSVGLDREADFINDFAFDRRGRVWCTTDAGLIVGEPLDGSRFRFSRVRPYRTATRFAPVAERADGRLWIGMGPDLVVLDGTTTGISALQTYPTPADEAIVAIVEAQSSATMIVITTRAVFEFRADAPDRWRRLNGSPPDGTTFYAATRAFGALWIGAEGRVLEIRGDTVHRWWIGRGLRPPISALRADRDGNLWIGTTQGLFRVPPWRIVEFTPADGLPPSSIARLLVAPGGRVFASTIDAGLIELTDVGAQLVAGTDREPFNRPSDRVVVTKDGLWLVATPDGIRRLDLEPQRPRMRSAREPLVRLPGIERMQLDATGRLWVRLRDRSVVFRIERGRLVPDDRSMPTDQPMPTFMTVVSTPGDGVWLGDMTTLHRRTGNRLEQLHATTGLLETRPRSTLLDSRGWLWIGMRYEGLALTTNPAANSPRFESLTMKRGLSSNIVSCLAEGKDGYVYPGTGRGIDRLDPASKQVETVGPASVLSGAWVRSCVTDQAGRIWASTVYGRLSSAAGRRRRRRSTSRASR
jgi:ligand-binding sensor domain-containing protein